MIGRTLSHYKVLEKIGEGGMGEVYLAKDTKLDREVAVKVLPATFSENKERLARFEREARLLASLNHPNIAAIFELEESDGVHFLALEYVPGETLAERIKRGPIPIAEALPLFKQIAEGLEAAHENGVIHRDLKPANIKVTPEGKVKVLDFGLAKAMAGESPTQELSESPTITRDATEAGVLLGTAPYMSPEQARGKPVDKRTDIWAFGCCLYEALAGKTAFHGETVTDTIARIVEREPNWDALPATTPVSLRRLLRRCLKKDSTHRLHDIADARIEIEEAAIEPPAERNIPGGARSRRGMVVSWGLAALAAVAVCVVVWFLRPLPPRPVSKLLVGVEPAEWLGPDSSSMQWRLSRTSFAFTSDGRNLIYSAGDDEGSQLYMRAMDEADAKPILGTEGAVGPFLSPDGQWIGFWAKSQLNKIRIDGGPPITLCNASEPPFGASWGPNGTIVYGQFSGGLLEVSGAGGEPHAIIELSEGEFSYRLPHFLPDGDTVLFTVLKGEKIWDQAQIAAYSLKTGERKVLIENGADARYAPTGHLVFARLGTLIAVPFDPTRLEITGGPVGVVEGVRQAVNADNAFHDTGATQLSFSSSGSLAYVPGGIFASHETFLVWVDLNGDSLPLPAPPMSYFMPRLSPDGQQVAATTGGLNVDIWIYDVLRRSMTRFTTEESIERIPIWAPDGTRITFASDRGGHHSFYRVPSDGSGSAELLTTTFGPAAPASWSPDGQVLAFAQSTTDDGFDILVLPLEGEPRPFIQSPFEEAFPTFSPDGDWLAYASNQSGRNEVYVTPYPGPGPRHHISTDGGQAPAWAPNGRRLFYRTLPDGKGLRSMMAVDIATEPTFTAGIPKELFKNGLPATFPVRAYDVTPDGRRFLMVQEVGQSVKAVTQIHVVLNWFEELKRLVPTN